MESNPAMPGEGRLEGAGGLRVRVRERVKARARVRATVNIRWVLRATVGTERYSKVR